MIIRVTLLAARQEPVSLEEPSAIKIGGPTTADPAIARSALAVAAATAFLALALARLRYETKEEGGSCCYRTPRPAWPV
jgi:hypothetical protein